jgi:hypothetical protein
MTHYKVCDEDGGAVEFFSLAKARAYIADRPTEILWISQYKGFRFVAICANA